ncbi:MAG: hypothetical protein IJG47_12095 [Microbacterium sp.]|nr:hypothetical protein [Microbacterium sp.]
MTTSIVLSGVSYLFSFTALAAALIFLAWIVWPDALGRNEGYGPFALWIALQFLGLQILLRAGTAVCALVIFAGPQGAFLDHLGAILRSRTGVIALFSGITSVGLAAAIKVPFGPLRPVVMTLLAILLVVLDTLVLKGIGHIARTSRAHPYFENMDSVEKDAADRSWPVLSRPSFPELGEVKSIGDARRYARRAKDIAELHVWAGAGLVVVFSAFIGTTLSASWEEPGLPSVFGLYLVLGAVALGFWLQRRARSYRSLSSDFEMRAEDLKRAEAMQAETVTQPRKRRLSNLVRRLFS